MNNRGHLQKEQKKSRPKNARLTGRAGFRAHANTPPRFWAGQPRGFYSKFYTFHYLASLTFYSMNRYPLYVCIFLMIGCSAPKDKKEDINNFLKRWAKALSLKDKVLRNFYDPAFDFPVVLVEDSASLSYTIDVDRIEISKQKNGGDIFAVVPFQLRDQEGQTENGKMKLTIVSTIHGFSIKDMSQELTKEVMWRNRRLQYDQELAQRMKAYDSIWNNVRLVALKLQQHYDTVVFFAKVDKQVLFYVANGDWVYPYRNDSTQYDSGNYKMGVVTAENKVIVPVEYTKIYNPSGTVTGVIEVERNGLRGLFKVNGEQLIPAEFQGIYPTKAPNAIAQLKKGGQYGWLDNKGNVSFDASSHNDKTLFMSPIESNDVLGWQFTYPGTIKVLIDMTGNSEYSDGVIVYPSFVRDLGITKVAHPWVLNDINEMGMGMTDTVIKFESAESLSDKLYGLISFFMESGADARGYQFSKNDLLILDNTMTKVDRLENLIANSYNQDPCGNMRSGPAYRIIRQGLYESNDGDGKYKYYKVTAEGKVEPQSTDRQYAFTKFAKIDERYFKYCHYENVPFDAEEYEATNVVVLSGVSSNELDIMRNEIFAEYGFIFKSAKWKTYFESKPWYKPQYDNVDQFLTEIDKSNIKFILEYQRLHKGMQVQRDSIRYGWAG
jgi:hypothetical protein